MARWLRFANTLGALELLAADVCAAAAVRPHCLVPRRFGPPVHPAVAGASPLHRPRSLAGQSLARSATADGGSASGAGACLARARARPHFAWRPTICPDSGPSLPPRSAASVSTNRRRCRPSARLGLGMASYRRGNSAQRLDEFRMTAHNGVDPPRSKPVFTPTRATTSLHVPGHTHLTTVGQELNRLAPSSCCRHRRPMGVRGRRAPTAQPSRVGKALPLFFGALSRDGWPIGIH